MIDAAYPLATAEIERFRSDGFVHLPQVFDAATLEKYEPTLTRLTLEHDPARNTPLAKRDVYGKAFIQVGNLWKLDPLAREFMFSQRLARIAAELLGTESVRMYHDQALYKEASGGFTPWHVDQQYWPLSSAQCVTAWVPLHEVPLEQGPMSFGVATHRKQIARELEISAESERVIDDEVRQRGIQEFVKPYALGEVSFHYGWTLHRAGPNTTRRPRKVQTIIYIDSAMRLAAPCNGNQERDWRRWSPSTRVGQVMADPLNPVLYTRARIQDEAAR
jgi:ectoine hydroxylase-related dioxygenase (phytanoyl-CoA dioxygenase family)